MHEHENSSIAALRAAFHHALTYLHSESTTSVAATADLTKLRARLDMPLEQDGVDVETVIDQLVSGARDGLLGSQGGRFFGWVAGGALPAALAADWLTAVWDQNAAMYACAPSAAVVEETVGRWLKQILGLPQTASFALVTGCQMAHVTCLAAARHALVARSGWSLEEDGMAGSPPLRVLTSTEVHGSTVRALRLLGIGARQIHRLPADAQGRMEEEALRRALAENPDTGTIVVLQAGDLNIGAYDDFARLIPLANSHDAWVHIDGAFGLWAATSPGYSHLLQGVSLADSWTTDGHKWLNVPYDCGYAFVADASAHRAAFTHQAAYIRHHGEARDEMEWNPEWSRRARGFATYAALRQLGTAGVADLVERTCAHAHALVLRIGALRGAELLWEPTINQGLVRFLSPLPGAGAEEHDAFTDRVIAEILATGEAFFSGTTWRGRRAMRVSVCNWQTTSEDVDRVLAGVQKALASTFADGHEAGSVRYAEGLTR